MINKKIIIGQIIGSTVILGVLLVGRAMPSSPLGTAYNFAMTQVMNEITIDEVTTTSAKIIETLKETPSKVVSAVTSANESSKYAYPIDEKATGDQKQVHAVAGGMISKVGNSKELGLFIVIKHEGAESTYGHLCNISVAPKERVQRGEIIGSYNTTCGEEFYYQLNENL